MSLMGIVLALVLLMALAYRGTSVHQALNTAVALGYGSEMVPSLVKAQAKLNQVTIVKA